MHMSKAILENKYTTNNIAKKMLHTLKTIYLYSVSCVLLESLEDIIQLPFFTQVWHLEGKLEILIYEPSYQPYVFIIGYIAASYSKLLCQLTYQPFEFGLYIKMRYSNNRGSIWTSIWKIKGHVGDKDEGKIEETYPSLDNHVLIEWGIELQLYQYMTFQQKKSIN